jgi:SAM-dependent methyltransferase
VKYWRKQCPNLYLGSIEKTQIQRTNGSFIGTSIYPMHFFEIYCDLSQASLPFASSSVSKVQGEDVLEHLDYEQLPKLFDEIHRVLVIGGVFRVSVPDYNSPFLLKRCVFNYLGEIVLDASTDSSVGFDVATGSPTLNHDTFGNSHLWFPTYSQIMQLIEGSGFQNSSEVVLHHGYLSDVDFFTEVIPDETMPVRRSPPGDMRSNGKPISLVLDIIKNS